MNWNVTPEATTSQLPGDRQPGGAATEQKAEYFIEGLNLACHFTLQPTQGGPQSTQAVTPTPTGLQIH
jgi:hypothetical protein